MARHPYTVMLALWKAFSSSEFHKSKEKARFFFPLLIWMALSRTPNLKLKFKIIQWLCNAEQGLLNLRKIPPASGSPHCLTPTHHCSFSMFSLELSHQFPDATPLPGTCSDLLSQGTLNRTSFFLCWHASLPHTHSISFTGARYSLRANKIDTLWHRH